ncbi:PilW family protein [Thiocystis violacea]|uniref:PilW family protein n=1 Tax=Thiocystis violacea TaxID=13725 RepID=UPI0019041F39|nr:PilW family protein [Thiocystis violacea]
MKTRVWNSTGTKHSQTGFSLIELMIAMAIGLALIASIGYVYLGAKSSYNSMEALATIQETARFTFEYMGDDVRMAGYTGGPANGGTPVNAVNAPSFDPNLIDLFQTPLIGYEQGGGYPSGLSPAPLATTDAVTVVHADSDREFSLCLPADTVATCVANNPAGTLTSAGTFTLRFTTCPTTGLPAAGEIMVASDYTHSALFQVSAAGSCSVGTMALTYDTATATPGNSTAALGAFSGAIQARKIFPLKASTYYVANNASGVPTLHLQELTVSGGAATTQTTELAQWVEDMQIEYGVDIDATPDQSVDDYYDADDVNAGSNGSTTIPGAAADRWQRVLSVRVTLSLTSRQDVNVTTTGTALTKQFTNTFAVRNRLL